MTARLASIANVAGMAALACAVLAGCARAGDAPRATSTTASTRTATADDRGREATATADNAPGMAAPAGAIATQAVDGAGARGAAEATPSIDGIVALPDLPKAAVFDGIDPKEADGFWNRWHLVTVRFRADNGEQRFIYANDVAWSAIERRAATYPDGAMFGKVAALTAPDPLFPNSVVPASAPRVQLMKKDAKRYASTDGWGYALYTARPPAHPEDEVTVVRACAACHRIAQSRDFVFAQPAFLARQGGPPASDAAIFAARFVETAHLTARGKTALASVDEHATSARVLTMPLFAGSLAESVGPVAGFAAASPEPFVLVDEETGYYLAAKAKTACVDVAMTLKASDGFLVRHGTVCNGVARWDPAR